MKAFFNGLAIAWVLVIICINLNLHGASWQDSETQVITSTGITGINVTKVTQEIYVINRTTTPCYIAWDSSTTVDNTNFALGVLDSADMIYDTPEVRASRIAVRQDTGPVNIMLEFRW